MTKTQSPIAANIKLFRPSIFRKIQVFVRLPSSPDTPEKKMYTPALLHTYKKSRSRLPIGAWISTVAKYLPQFKDDASIYAAVPLQIKIAGNLNSSNGNVSLSVAAFEPNWYNGLVGALEKMTNRQNLQVVNYLKEPINGMTPAQLAGVGECDVIDTTTKKPIRLAAIVPPPLELATNKSAQLAEWWNSVRDDLSHKIAASFKGMSMAEVAKATSGASPSTCTLIANYLNTHTLHNLSWDKFAKTFSKSSSSVSLDQVSSCILNYVCQALVSNETQVRDYHAISGEATLWKRGAGGGTTRYKDDVTMYRDIVEDAMYHTSIGQNVIQSILYGINKKGQSKPKSGQNNLARFTPEDLPPPQRRRQPARLEESSDEEEELMRFEEPVRRRRPQENEEEFVPLFNPITSYYRDYHQPVYKKLPTHHIEALNKNYGKAEVPYPGDPEKVVEMFNLYTGRSIIGCNSCKIAKRKKRQQLEEEPIERRLIPIETGLPRLIPINAKSAPSGADFADRPMPKLIPINGSVKRSLPPLIPIDADISTPEVPPLIQMGTDFTDDYEPTIHDFL